MKEIHLAKVRCFCHARMFLHVILERKESNTGEKRTM